VGKPNPAIQVSNCITRDYKSQRYFLSDYAGTQGLAEIRESPKLRFKVMARKPVWDKVYG
jgi:hypothetical protein